MYYLVSQNGEPVAAFARAVDLRAWQYAMRFTLDTFLILRSVSRRSNCRVVANRRYRELCPRIPHFISGPLQPLYWPTREISAAPSSRDVPEPGNAGPDVE